VVTQAQQRSMPLQVQPDVVTFRVLLVTAALVVGLADVQAPPVGAATLSGQQRPPLPPPTR
jgi:hypothetical protein